MKGCQVGAMLHKVSEIVSHWRLRWRGHFARMLNEGQPKRVLSRCKDGGGRIGNSPEQWADCVTIPSRENLQIARLHTHGGESPKTRHAGGLP